MSWVSRIMTQSLKSCPTKISVYQWRFSPNNKIPNDLSSVLCIWCPFVGQVLLLSHDSTYQPEPDPILQPPSEAFRFPDREDARGSRLRSGRSVSFCQTVQTPRNIVRILGHAGALNRVLEAKLTGPKYLGNKSTHVCSNMCGLVGWRKIPRVLYT